MKKAIMFAAALLAAAATQAASYNWSGTDLYQDWSDADSENYIAGTAYLFVVGVNGVTASDLTSAVSGGTFLADNWASKAADSTAIRANQGMFGSTYEAATDLEGADMYSVVLATGYYDGSSAATATGVDPAYITISDAVAAPAQPASGIGGADVDFGSFYEAGKGGPGGWAVTPEPCSVALLLLGAAAVGLKRKRA